jgi:hypothetical protein
MAEEKDVISTKAIKEQLEEVPGSKAVSLNDMVTFQFNYPKDYPLAKKRFADGHKEVIHREVATMFEKELGIGKITSK